jgi:hypothetical protein
MTLETYLPYLNLVKELSLVGAALYAAYIAKQGLNTWKNQLKGSVEYDLARRLLWTTYRLRDEIQNVRNSFIYTMPKSKALATLDATTALQDTADFSHEYRLQFDKVVSVRAEIAADRLHAEVLWGDEIQTTYEPLDTIWFTLYSAIQNNIAFLNAKTPIDNFDEKYEQYKEREKIQFSGIDQKFDDELSEIIKSIETYLKPHLAN